MSPYVRKTNKVSRKRTSSKRKFGGYRRYHRSGYRSLSRRISAVSRRVAGEVCKFESTPHFYSNSQVVVGTSATTQYPLDTITSGTPWIMPLNWYYRQTTGSATGAVYANGQTLTSGTNITLSVRNPLWYNTLTENTDTFLDPTTADALNDISPGLQYRMKYIYINALFNASISNSVNNTDGALRIVIIKDKQPTGGSATWFDEGTLNNGENHRGVFNSNRIDAQLNPNTVGRFKIMYDKTLRFTTISGYKPFKYFKKLSTVVRNNRDIVGGGNTSTLSSNQNKVETSERPPPVQKSAYYLMIFSDGLTFSHSTAAETPAASFHLFNRIAYYNN